MRGPGGPATLGHGQRAKQLCRLVFREPLRRRQTWYGWASDRRQLSATVVKLMTEGVGLSAPASRRYVRLAGAREDEAYRTSPWPLPTTAGRALQMIAGQLMVLPWKYSDRPRTRQRGSKRPSSAGRHVRQAPMAALFWENFAEWRADSRFANRGW